MPQARFIKTGETQSFTAGAAYTAGDVIQINTGRRVGVVARDVASGDTGEYYTSGVFEFTKTTGALTNGALVWWDDTNNYVNTSGDFMIGTVVVAAASGDTTVMVDLNRFNMEPNARWVKKVVSTTGTTTIFNANAPYAFKVIDGFIICTNNVAGTVKLTDGTNDITDTLTHGTTDKAIVRFATIDDAYHSIAVGGTLSVVSATGGTSIVYVLIDPV